MKNKDKTLNLKASQAIASLGIEKIDKLHGLAVDYSGKMLKKLKTMTKNEKLKQIREAVDLALEAQGLESTRALVAGCKIKTEEWCCNTLHILTLLEKVWIQGKRELNKNRKFEDEWVYKMSDGQLIGLKELEYKNKNPNGLLYQTKIIGRDIDWEDCFLAMENPEISFRYFFGKPLKIQIEKGGHLMCTWKPKVPLHLQDPTTIDFIHNLIVNNK